MPFDHLVVLHSHWRPGGVRRVVELALPGIVRAAGSGLRKVTLLSGGEAEVRPELPPLGVETVFHVEPAFDYLPPVDPPVNALAQRIGSALEVVCGDGDARRMLVWFHNPALAKNPLVCARVREFSRRTGAAVVMHHHDFWCAGRWERWETLVACGIDSLDEAAEVAFAGGARCRHVAINLADHRAIGPFFPGRVDYLPNPIERPRGEAARDMDGARAWLAEKTGGAPLWVCPTRLLRRKNLLEALLLVRWLRPTAVLATTSGAFSPDEAAYASAVRGVAERSGGSFLVGLLDGVGAPRVSEVLRCAEAVVLSSVKEGFGMGFVEAAAAGTPVVARRLPQVEPDLEALGFSFPHLYDEVWIDPELLDMEAEMDRRRGVAARWGCGLFKAAIQGVPELKLGGAVAFARLTLAGQLEVLERKAEESWEKCRRWNPGLVAMNGSRLKATPWPLGGRGSVEEYAGAFLAIARAMPEGAVEGDPAGAQSALVSAALGAAEFFPLLQ